MKICPDCGGYLHAKDTRIRRNDGAPSYTTRRKECQACGKRFTTHEIWVEELRKNDPGYVPLDRREEYKHLMRKLKLTRAEVLQIMGLLDAAQEGQVEEGHQREHQGADEVRPTTEAGGSHLAS